MTFRETGDATRDAGPLLIVGTPRRIAVLLLLLAVAILSLPMLLRGSRGVSRQRPPSFWNDHHDSRGRPPPGQLLQHPVKQLHHKAMQDFVALIDRQSASLPEAVEEYIRRYQRPPPKGFDAWFQFAKSHGSVIIDDFDSITESLKPLWRASPQSIRDSLEAVTEQAKIWRLASRAGNMTTHEQNWMGTEIARLMDSYGVYRYIPDLDILMNPFDEPRVLSTDPPLHSNVRWTDASGQRSWERIHKPCSRLAAEQDPEADVTIAPSLAYGIELITNVAQSRDLCRHRFLRDQHGFMICPDTLITTDEYVPVLSQATATTFSDILYPSMWYWKKASNYDDQEDPVWRDKLSGVYWAGRTTGIHTRSSQGTDAESHRHRLVRLTNQAKADVRHRDTFHFLAHTADQGWVGYESDELQLPLYDVKFTEAVQCDEGACEQMEFDYEFGDMEPFNTSYASKLVIDIDGNSFSGRFYNFLKSKSCPLKITIFHEWHDERLVPWVHYIPISIGMQELPEVVRYLSLTNEGDAIAAKIANMGRQWHDKMLRKQDAAIYLFRLFLEYARVINDGRDRGEMDYHLPEQ